MLDVQVSAVQSLAISAAAVALGAWMQRRIPLLQRSAIPAPIIGGLIFALAVLALRGRVANFAFDTSLRDLLMLVCFTIIGLNSSLDLLKRGGLMTPWLLALASLGSILQNATGMALAKLLGLQPLIGALAGSVSLAGGPATSIAFGAEFEKLGVPGAATIGLASATFGIAVSGLIAGPLGDWIVRRNSLRPSASQSGSEMEGERSTRGALLSHSLWIAVCLGAGSLVSGAVAAAKFTLPGYVGAMVVAAVVRNLDDRFHFARFSALTLGEIFQAALPLFIGIAMATLKLWDLSALAVPLLALLCAQIAITALFCAACFRFLGRDYDGAVIAAGFTGFMVGITPNAMASMAEIEAKHGPSPKAILTVPIVGGFLNDFTNSVIITAFAGFVAKS